MVTVRFSAISHPGSVREHNEDSFAVGERLAVIADGVGGHAAGEVASALVVDAFGAIAEATDLDGPEEALREAIASGNARIAQEAEANPEQQGMGTTVVAMWFDDGSARVAHVGDSRAYRLRDGKIERLTRDDSYVQLLVDEGALDESEIPWHPYRSIVMKALMGQPVEATVTEVDLVEGDRFMLCSDGLSDVVNDGELCRVLAEVESADDVGEALVQLALDGGGPDNITVIVADAVRPVDPS